MAKKKVKSKAKQPPKPSISKTIASEIIAETYNTAASPVFIKVCRLCETKDGPFLNIFDADKVTAKKIDELMPFGIAENDDLPHKICFRCSAKLEELHEFIQRCIKTQESLRTAIGKTGPFISKTKTRKAWEDKLNKTNMSNDDICDALIKKAMEGIKGIPLKPVPVKEESPPISKRITRRTEPMTVESEPDSDDNKDRDINHKDVKLSLEKTSVKVPTIKPAKSINSSSVEPPQSNSNKKQEEKKPSQSTTNTNTSLNSLSFDYVEEKPVSDEEVKELAEKPFNIMDYISMIKVNGVGVLFQCKLCNRNFLKKEVVESHNCAKNGVPKVAVPKTVPTPEPPKVSTVKYITLDGNNMKKPPNAWKSYKIGDDHSDHKYATPTTDSNESRDVSLSSHSNNTQDCTVVLPPVKPKPKAGPASKTRRLENSVDPGSSSNSDSQQSQSENPPSTSVHIPSAPNLNGRFKLVPGPNNIFTLVEDLTLNVTESKKSSKKRKSDSESEIKTKDRKKDDKPICSEIINLEDNSKPYPVGLFQTVAHSAALYPSPEANPPATFTTPAMKKQSYTIVQTGHPSKLLISTKAQAAPAVPRKRPRKSKLSAEVRHDEDEKEPFRVTLEDVAHPKDTGFFTFINVDPLLQPSYVLPTDNIIQESQISTSTAVIHNATESSKESKDKDKYPCNMCGESFSREKKLLAHIQSHYTKMDEEDQLRAEKSSKKKGRK